MISTITRFLSLLALSLISSAAVAAPLRYMLPGPLLVAVSGEPEAIAFALMPGECPTLKVAGLDYNCRAVAFSQTEEGRASFVIAHDDPEDDSHIITFSGDRGARPKDDLYELPIDEMEFKSKDRPKVDGLPTPLIAASIGSCQLIGSLASQQVASIACSATDRAGERFELRFVSDGSPITLRRIRRERVGGPPIISPFD